MVARCVSEIAAPELGEKTLSETLSINPWSANPPGSELARYREKLLEHVLIAELLQRPGALACAVD
jgi:hypothetical protein